MTHILITDLREIRYMAYVPEEPKVCAYRTCDRNHTCMNHCRRAMDEQVGYQSALEKAKRESVPFDLPEDRERVFQVLYGHTAHLDLPLNYQKWKEELKPGIYQVPVEVEVVEITMPSVRVMGQGYHINKQSAAKKFARIVQPKEEEESSAPSEFATSRKFERFIQSDWRDKHNKPESQEELIQAFFDMVAEQGENLSYSELSKHFTLTRKRG